MRVNLISSVIMEFAMDLPISTTTSRALEIRISLFLYDTFHLLYISQVLFTAACLRPQNIGIGPSYTHKTSW